MYYSDQQLATKRQEGDAAADAVVQEMFANTAHTAQYMRQLHSIKTNQDLTKAGLSPFLQEYFSQHQQLPPWADTQAMNRASVFFDKHTQPVLLLLGLLSLPYCYAAALGAKVLCYTERIRSQTYQRLGETAQFVVDVTAPQGFGEQGSAWASILKVRLMHATVRHHLLRHKTWDSSHWGVPVNQEDMAGTNLAFSWLVLRGLRHSGWQVSSQEALDYLHLWNVIGYGLGISEDLLPNNAKAAFWLSKRIGQRHFRPSEEGQSLTKALLQSLAQSGQDNPVFARLPQGFWVSYMRDLLGAEIADMLDIPAATLSHQALIWALKQGIQTQNFLFGSQPSRRTSANIRQQLAQWEAGFVPPLHLG
ncbi:oxygenase MpaB family protein [Eisenibacter elegans]|jgi:hypothetical protein|uniref:oxygenase MpaB family protein n=1 Tax=Eisenibacter elegans TaxID=997 RepID=UPI0004229E05|nr:oxygenase MpaB family protein [Eisenibacter elegans]